MIKPVLRTIQIEKIGGIFHNRLDQSVKLGVKKKSVDEMNESTMKSFTNGHGLMDLCE